MIDARLPDGDEGGTKTYIRSLAEALASQNRASLRVAWVVLPFSSWWKPMIGTTDHIFVDWDLPRLSSAALAKLLPKKLLAFIKKAYFGSGADIRYSSVAQKIKNLDFDLVHFPIQDAFYTDIPYLYHPHDLQHLHYPQYFDPSIVAHREKNWREFALKSAKVVCASQFIKQDLVSRWGIDSGAVEVLPISSPSPVLKSFEIENEDPASIIYVANFWPHKNQKTLIEAVALIENHTPPLTLTLVGTGPELEACISLSQELDITNQVKFVGHLKQKELESLVSRHQIVCVPSEFEAASFPIIEGMKFKKLVIASSIKPFLEIEESGLILYGSPKDAVALASTLRSAIDNYLDYSKTFSAQARYLESISPRETGNRLVEIYQNILLTT